MLAALVSALIAAPTALVGPQAAAADGSPLALGDADLPETRMVEALAPGVTLTTIVRGAIPASPDQIATTRRGPWQVRVVSIDPTLATGRLVAGFGPDLAHTEPTTRLVSASGALAGVNASYFTFRKSKSAPGDPVGLGLYGGVLLSEPAAVPHEVDLLVDSATHAVTVQRLDWSGKLRNRRTGRTLKLEYLNHPPVVPRSCRSLRDQSSCRRSGDVVLFRPEFGRTPRGKGLEVVLDRSGCAQKISTTRGRVLRPGQTSVQATGRQIRQLRRLVSGGCVRTSLRLLDEQGRRVPVSNTLYGVAGRYRLTHRGAITAPHTRGVYFARHPRTIAGTTSSGHVVLATIDGRRPTSVGATLREAAAVADSLGLTESVNLDGGGSTTLSVRGVLANQPSGAAERPVGDALMYLER